ncbi:Arginyl-tRNA--protein transferase 1 [Cladophialophora chaetospira]|uniref:arginyltransferase n=1 Tax=Cladophialophora chaetospira TaxID=386627 RepID=A0AA38XIK9_9EURO|nr:Arginyl-tRNA--protein transferase 1 [Cladophialophora chaetospira]
MRVDHYQYLMDRGWRRSGSLYYKPDLVRSCCPHYTIRYENFHQKKRCTRTWADDVSLKASDFQPRRGQRQAVNRLNDVILGPEYKRKAAMLSPQTREYVKMQHILGSANVRREKRRLRGSFDLLHAVHRAEYDNVKRPTDKKSNKPIEPAHKFEVNLEGDNFTKEKYRVFLKYQLEIHKDPASRWKEAAFKRFLCTGVDRKVLKIGSKTLKLGSYHQCYRLDGKLVAVGVLDLLPHAVSSVYLFYDPEYSHWDLGKVSALREAALAMETGYEYYYMGYYIHSCIKMRYKATFTPTYMLDPETFEWNHFDDAYRTKLDQRQYVSPAHDRRQAQDEGEINALSSTAAKINASAVPKSTKETGQTFDDEESLEFDEIASDEEDAEIPEGSLFDYGIPGVMTKDEVKRLNLSNWHLVVRNALIELEDLRGWEDWKIDDPGSIRGIAAELIAASGPELLQNSALVLF